VRRMPSDAADKPGVVAPPPLIYLGAIVVGALLERVWRWEIPTAGWGAAVGALLILIAGVLLVLAVLEFKRAGTPPEPYKPTTAIVTSGPYRVSRNPIYLAFTLVQLGIALWMGSGWILVLLLPVSVLINYAVIAREERYLDRKFGDEYFRYRRKVRRWI
jgi:protein-S-isoprenylcysteine O-methyltransferase Ste14